MTSAGGGGRDRLLVVGAGRVGLALGLALHRAGALEALDVAGRRVEVPAHPLFAGDPAPARYVVGVSPGGILSVDRETTGILLAVPDPALPEVVALLAVHPLPSGIPVLHTSGVLDLAVLDPLRRRGAEPGSLHPLAAVADPVGGAERLRGAHFGIEGRGAARALAERVVAACGGTPLSIAAGGKARYHAAAVFASNYAVALLAVAERLMGEAGVATVDARPALMALARGAVENVAARGPARALTGPVARGDETTVRLHLAELSPGLRPLYSLLGREALELALTAGLEPTAAERIADVLEEAEP